MVTGNERETILFLFSRQMQSVFIREELNNSAASYSPFPFYTTSVNLITLSNTDSHADLYGCSTYSGQQRSLLTDTLDDQILINAKELEKETVLPKFCSLWSVYKMTKNIMHPLRPSPPPFHHTHTEKKKKFSERQCLLVFH